MSQKQDIFAFYSVTNNGTIMVNNQTENTEVTESILNEKNV